MKRYSSKKLYDKVITKLLKNNYTNKDGKQYQFEYYTYDKGVYVFVFTELANKEKAMAIQLYYQHFNDYEDTYELLTQTFIKIELREND